MALVRSECVKHMIDLPEFGCAGCHPVGSGGRDRRCSGRRALRPAPMP